MSVSQKIFSLYFGEMADWPVRLAVVANLPSHCHFCKLYFKIHNSLHKFSLSSDLESGYSEYENELNCQLPRSSSIRYHHYIVAGEDFCPQPAHTVESVAKIWKALCVNYVSPISRIRLWREDVTLSYHVLMFLQDTWFCNA